MATINNDNLEKIKAYYKDGLSIQEIANKLGVSLNSAVYFFRKHSIHRRTTRESNIIKFNKKPLTFNLRSNLSYNDEKLKVAGLMLYWAEGSSRNHTVDLANCDVLMIKLFLKFLRRIYRINEKKLRVYLYCYSNQNKDKLIEFWSQATKIPESQFSKPYVRTDYSMKFGRQMEYGLVHIRYNDKKLLTHLTTEINKFIKENK